MARSAARQIEAAAEHLFVHTGKYGLSYREATIEAVQGSTKDHVRRS